MKEEKKDEREGFAFWGFITMQQYASHTKTDMRKNWEGKEGEHEEK